MPFNIITIIEIFEELEVLSFFVRDQEGNLSSRKIFRTRIALLTLIFVLTLISTDIAMIFDLVGAMFGPILGFILPVKYPPITPLDLLL